MEDKDFNEEINNQFEEFQRRIEDEEKKLKFITLIDVPNEFFNLIDDVCNTDLSSY